ncbi:MAG TPA: TonB-dependent receptor [Bryobacteraceae bacterium]|nr:TonB-dependent receptor [Bryobacteraceae bacterium]
MLWKNLVCFFLIATACLFAQNDRGTITGTVLDQQGAVVPNASIVARNAESHVEYRTVATGTGNYTIPALPAGPYSVNIESPGFKRFIQNGIVVQVAQTARIDVSLQIGSISESITITAEAPLLKTENAEQSTVVTTERINQLPLNFGGGGGNVGAIRSPYNFNILSPGVGGTGFSTTTNPSSTTANVNGMQASTFRVQVDGQDATSQNDIGWTSTVAQPSVDMLQEFSLQTSNYAAEYGQIGGGLYNFTTKSGTNELHGTGYEYFTNEALNAYRPFTYQNPRSRKNDFGGTISGPVWIPKLYNGRNRTFFFFNLEVYRNTVNTAGNFITLPTAAMRGGDFSALLGAQVGTDVLGRPILANQIYDPGTVRNVNGNLVTDPFARNVIPTSRLDPVALKMQNLIPAPTNAGLVNNWAQLAGNYRRQTIPAFKIDEILPDNSKVSFYFSKQNTSQLTSVDGLPYPISAVRVQAIYGTTARLNYDRSISPTVLWHSGIGYQRFNNPDTSPPQVLGYDAASQLGFTGSSTNPGGFPRINWPTVNALGAGSSTNFGPSNANNYFDSGLTANSTATWVHGNHTYKIGAEYRLDSWTDRNSRGAQGILNFSPNETGLPYLQNSAVGGQTIGFAYASFLLGQADTASVNAVQDPQWRKPAWGLFLQDTWKISSKLTLDYGLRWDWQTEGHEIHYRTSMFGPTIPNPSAGGLLGGLVYEGYGAGRCNCTFSRAYPYAIAPRIGLAWQLNSKTVVRAGWGVSYGQVPTFNYVTNGTLLGVGFNSIAFSSPSFGAPGATLSQGLQYDRSQLYTASLNPGIVPYAGQLNSPNYLLDSNSGRPPRIMQWTFGLQREVSRSLLVEANWVGNRGAWLSQPNSSSVTSTLANLNATNPATFAAAGINPATAAGQSLLLSTFASGIPQAHGFNPPYAGYPQTATLAQALRPYPQFGNIPLLWAPLGSSWYQSLQAKVTKRYSHGLTLNAAFTWSKSLANPAGPSNNGQVNNVFNRGVNKSVTSFDQPYIFNVGFTYEIPAYSRNRIARAITGGWSLGGLLQYASGIPIPSPVATTNMSSLVNQTTLMNRVPGVPLYLTNPNCGCVDPNKQFAWNSAAWTNPAPGSWGMAAPYYSDFRYGRRPSEQMSLGRLFRIREGMSLQIRAELFNLFNRTYLSNPSTLAPTNPQAFNSAGVPTSGWGYINSTTLYAQPRNGQLVARFTF